jgi:hypothetical protein
MNGVEVEMTLSADDAMPAKTERRYQLFMTRHCNAKN